MRRFFDIIKKDRKMIQNPADLPNGLMRSQIMIRDCCIKYLSVNLTGYHQGKLKSISCLVF